MASEKLFFNPEGKGLEVFLGPTEARLMKLAWEEKNITVKRALYLLGDNKKKAYTTIMTILSRLSEKGLLNRQKDGKTFVYTAAITQNKFLASRIKIINKCLKQFK